MKQLKTFLIEEISNEISNINGFITEGVYNYAPKTPEECRTYFNSIGRKIKQNGSTILQGQLVPTEFIDLIYNIWIDNFESEPDKIPFRCDGKHVKLSPLYELYKEDILTLKDNIDNLSLDIVPGKIHINGITIIFGNGSLKGVRSSKGLSYEDDVIAQLIKVIELIAGKHDVKKLNQTEFNDTVTDKALFCFYNMYEKGALDEVLDLYISNKDNPIDLTKIIIKTGGGNTKRNSKGEIFDSDFNITDSDIEQVLKDSGDIISDITIKTDNPVYISVKMKSSQLSGVMYRKAIATNETFKNAVMTNESWDSIKSDSAMIPYINVCTTLGIIPEEVFAVYKRIFANESKDTSLRLNKKYDPKKLGCIFQKLLGGNYWYVKPGICEYVDYKNANLKFNIQDAKITSTGKGININGDINGLKCEINFRTDGDRAIGPYPYRLFPKVSVIDLIKKV